MGTSGIFPLYFNCLQTALFPRMPSVRFAQAGPLTCEVRGLTRAINIVDVCPHEFIPTTETYVDDESSCSSTPDNAFTYKCEARDDGETHEPPPPPPSPQHVHNLRLDNDLTSAAHAQIDTGADVSCTDLTSSSLLSKIGKTTGTLLWNMSLVSSILLMI